MSKDFRVTANLPSRDFAKTREFYARLGFEDHYVSDQWIILKQADQTIEFFPYPKLKPYKSSFSVCFRVTDLDAVFERFQSVGLSTNSKDIPRLTGIETLDHNLRIFHLVDLDGTLIRCIEG
ncbi:MAG: bleomycin resistance protein [Paracoccaceae bacterium]|nr:bleomycin resistance protein [Paracoccaceae bacterium]MDG1738566.1 bleomycin resistance protein [Paracoccaceae bacterium]MDG2256996.1 bleomycin resistance protein [Paracoccaceae bacterium]